MKHAILLFLAGLFSAGLFSQAPAGINYQAVARNGDGDLLANESVTVLFSLRPVAGGNDVYAESHQVTTNTYGLFTAVIGQGATTLGSFGSIDWTTAFELGVEVDGTDLGYTPLQSVPYALNTAPREHAIGIPAASFTPNNSTATWRSSIGTGGITVNSTNGAPVITVLNAPLALPHGSRVTSMTVHYTDNSAEELRIWIAKENYTANFSIVAEVNTEGAVDGPRNNTINFNHLVDNTDGAYYLRVFCSDWNAPGAKVIRGVRVTYTY